MMASLVIDSIRSALDDLERSNRVGPFNRKNLRRLCFLKNLELFVLCVRKLGNDAYLRFGYEFRPLSSLLRRIHDAVSREPEQIQPDRVCWGTFLEFERDIFYDFDGDIGHWYTTMLDSLPQPTFHEVTEIIHSIAELLDKYFFYCYNELVPEIGIRAIVERKMKIEVMVERMAFFQNFIRFATLSGVEPRELENLLVHIQAVSTHIAHISYELCKKEGNYLGLWRTIDVIDPGVYETYTQALTLMSSKLSTRTPDTDHDPLATMKDFIDSLMSKLWERMQMDTRMVVSTSFQPQSLYECLRLLRRMLKEQQSRFDEEIRELTRVVICHAGVIVFSLYEKDVQEMVVSISDDLLQRINRIRQEVEGKDISISDLLLRFDLTREGVGGNDLPRISELVSMDCLLKDLVGMTSSKACYGFQTQFQTIHGELSSLRSYLGKIVEVRNEQKELEALWNAGVKVAYRVEFLIDQLVLGDFQCSFSTSFDSTIEEILKEIKSINSEIHHASDIEGKKLSMASNLVPPRTSVPIADEIVGLDDDAASITYRLTRASKQLKMVAIVGMPGIGKTTLATKVYNHPSVTCYFHKRAWCCVSQSFNRGKVLLELLTHIYPNGKFEMAEQDLSQELWRSLKRKRYLIFLDDVWDIEVWNCLRESFPDDSCGSRIILTSRHHVAAPPSMLDEEPHFPRPLTTDESLELMKRRLFPETDWPPASLELGKQIAEICKGLPLTVVIVAGLLATIERESWKKVLESLSSSTISSTDHCMNILELSYKHLPEYLKPCFLYFGLFPEDQEIPVKRLIWLWIAEGFVLKPELTELKNLEDESKSLEDVARDYMMDLVCRSLVIVSKKRSIGGVRACRIHDLLHDFCRIKAKEGNFFQLLKGYDELLSFEEPSYMRRICVHSEKKHFKNLRLFCPRIHSLIFFAPDEKQWRFLDSSFIIPRYSRLRVLDIRQYWLDGGIPCQIGFFLQLKYLAVSCEISDIPSSIGNLLNLEILILNSSFWITLPDTFWNLQRLRHLAGRYGFWFRNENLENLPDLCELQSCCAARIGMNGIERLVRKFPKIRELNCHLDWDDYNVILIPESLSQLESLHLFLELPYRMKFEGCSFASDFPGNLRKLSLQNFNKFSLHRSDISRIGKLHHLKVLKLSSVDFHEETWDVAEGEFPALVFLELYGSNIVRWTAASDDQFPHLQKLVLRYCGRLEEIPCCFEDVGALEMIMVSCCSASAKSFFDRIKNEQMELGNSLPKIDINDGFSLV